MYLLAVVPWGVVLFSAGVADLLPRARYQAAGVLRVIALLCLVVGAVSVGLGTLPTLRLSGALQVLVPGAQ